MTIRMIAEAGKPGINAMLDVRFPTSYIINGASGVPGVLGVIMLLVDRLVASLTATRRRESGQ